MTKKSILYQNKFSDLDHQHMQRAVELAWQGRFSTSPNPRVGCVVAHGKQIVGQGFHVKAGEPHAEIHALRQAGVHAQGATAYITLEPCAHYGKTPPCAKALQEAGIKRVVAAMCDPNPLVAGKGLAILQAAGILVEYGLLEHEARQLNRGFLSRIERHRPFVSLKIAASLDGKIALSNGCSQWITGEQARDEVHILRAQSCAVLTGIGTILADNPRLNVRAFSTMRQPIRVVLDSHFRLPETSNVVQDGGETWLFTQATCPNWLHQYDHVRVFRQPESNVKLNLDWVCQQLAQNGIGEVLLEAGQTLATAFLQADLVDEIVYFQSSKLLGDAARGIFRLPENQAALHHSSDWQTIDVAQIGNDIKWILHKKSS